MSSFYSRVRDELVGGGGDPTAATPSDNTSSENKVPLSTSILGVGVIVALLAWLPVYNLTRSRPLRWLNTLDR